MGQRFAIGAGFATLVTAAVLVAAGASASPAGEKQNLTQNWGIATDPDGDCKFTEKDGKLTVAVPGTYHDFHPKTEPLGKDKDVVGKVNAPRVFQSVEGDFTVEVQAAAGILPEKGTDLPGRTYAFRAATLLVWQDADNFVRLEFAGIVQKDKPNTFIYYHVFKDGKRINSKGPFCKDEPTVLRLERKGKKILASWQQGKTTNKLPDQTLELAAKLQAGVGAVNVSTKAFEAEFSAFKVSQGKK